MKKISLIITSLLIFGLLLSSCQNEKDYDCTAYHNYSYESYGEIITDTDTLIYVFEDLSKSDAKDIETHYTRSILNEETGEVLSAITMTCEESKF